MGKIEGRNITPILKMIRNILLGRRHDLETSHLRYKDNIPPRTSSSSPAIPVQAPKLAKNYYYTRDSRRQVTRPFVISESTKFYLEKTSTKPESKMKSDTNIVSQSDSSCPSRSLLASYQKVNSSTYCTSSSSQEMDIKKPLIFDEDTINIHRLITEKTQEFICTRKNDPYLCGTCNVKNETTLDELNLNKFPGLKISVEHVTDPVRACSVGTSFVLIDGKANERKQKQLMENEYDEQQLIDGGNSGQANRNEGSGFDSKNNNFH